MHFPTYSYLDFDMNMIVLSLPKIEAVKRNSFDFHKNNLFGI
jgi:hypothetical protein